MPKRNEFHYDTILTRIKRDSTTGCWLWQGGRDGCHYGRLTLQGRSLAAHRLSAHLWKGFDLASKLYVCHICDTPPCCNPDHLFIGTQKDNMTDSLRKGRHVDNRGSRHGKAILDEDDVLFIRALASVGCSRVEIGHIFNTNKNHLSDLINRRIWKHI